MTRDRDGIVCDGSEGCFMSLLRLVCSDNANYVPRIEPQRVPARRLSPLAQEEAEGDTEEVSREESDNEESPKVRRRSIIAKDSSQSLSSTETEFEESEKTLSQGARKVAFALEKNEEHAIDALKDMPWRTRRDCYWQPEEYQAMSQSRLWLERAVMQTGGRVRIEGESRRGLGLVCEPETRIARASKIQQTQRAVLRMHAQGASASRLAKFAQNASGWATRNALICAQKDLAAAHEPDDAYCPRPLVSVPQPLDMSRCDSNTAENNGLAAMIRNDSLGNLRTASSDTLAAFARARRRIAPAAAFPAYGSVSAVSA